MVSRVHLSVWPICFGVARRVGRVTYAVTPKPDTCKGCPFYGDGLGWVQDEVIEGAEVYVVGQNPGPNEVLGRRLTGWDPETWEPCPPGPYLGKTGYDMNTKFFPLAGLQRGQVSVGNAIRCRWRNSDKLPPLTAPELRQAIEHCQRAYFRPPASTRLFVAEGEYAMFALTGEDGRPADRSLTSWRGWLLPFNPHPRPKILHHTVYTPSPGDTPVLVTYHLAYLYRAPWERVAAMQDWKKVGQVLAGTWPEPFPMVQRTPPAVWPDVVAFDTEFVPPTGKLIRYSLAYREGGKKPYVWVVEARGEEYRAMRSPIGKATVIFHNAPADLAYLNEVLPEPVPVCIEDTMFQHGVLWSDQAHDLNYVGSLYARTNRWKHLEWVNPVQYSAGDALGTWDSWAAQAGELRRDPLTETCYRLLLRLIPMLLRHKALGVRTNQARITTVVNELEALKLNARRKAQAAVGWGLNVGSPAQVAHQLYVIEGIKPVRER